MALADEKDRSSGISPLLREKRSPFRDKSPGSGACNPHDSSSGNWGPSLGWQRAERTREGEKKKVFAISGDVLGSFPRRSTWGFYVKRDAILGLPKDGVVGVVQLELFWNPPWSIGDFWLGTACGARVETLSVQPPIFAPHGCWGGIPVCLRRLRLGPGCNSAACSLQMQRLAHRRCCVVLLRRMGADVYESPLLSM